MALIDLLVTQAPQSVYLFPTPTSAVKGLPQQSDSLYFQYWPQSLTDDYQVEYAEHMIPGGSHPLYQWVGGRGRTISFEAVFTAEVNTKSTGTFVGGGNSGPASAAATVANSIGTSLLPSSTYTVDVGAALSKIRSWMMPEYATAGRLGSTDPPKILSLVFPGTGLGGGSGQTADMLEVILRSAPITYESWFPDGTPRVATVTLTFNEIVQTPSGSDQNSGTKIQFKSRTDFEKASENYKFRGLPDRPFAGG
jgi:hypothetical protein